jgi:hypothetical protein
MPTRLFTITEISRFLNRDARNVERARKTDNIQPVAFASFRGKLVGLYRRDQFPQEAK